MKTRWIAWALIFILMLAMAGCRDDVPETLQTFPTEATDPTDPTQPTDAPEETTAPTEPETLPPETIAETQPPATDPPATKPPATEPPATEPPATEPPATEPPATEPPVTTAPIWDPYDISQDTVTALEREIMDLLNEERTKAGLEPLEIDPELCAITSVRAYETSILFDHTRPNGESCFSVLDDYGYDYWSAGENILYCSVGYYDAADMVRMWMESDGHRGNILGTSFDAFGLGVYEYDGLYYVANLFVSGR